MVAPMGAPKKTQRSLLVDLLVVVFGVSSWVAVNGLWVELPVLVKTLPESWKLPSYIVITTQVANLGPVFFGAARKIWSQKVLELPFIHGSLAVVVASCALLSVFWDATTYVFGELHSTALLVLTFLVSCVDCTSSLLYLPFVANFKEQYVLSYMIGAGLSGPIPGMLALAQGVGGYAECRNVTEKDGGNATDIRVLEPFYPPPRFSENVFFGALTLQMLLSWIAFVLLNELPQAKKERVSLLPVSPIPSNPALSENFQSSVEDKELSSSVEQAANSNQNLLGRPNLTLQQFYILLIIQGFVCAQTNGILSSVQTYSCLPYGSLAYHLSVTLSSIANPVCCFVAVFLPVTSVASICGLAVFGTVWGAYILMLALLSPDPPFVGEALGSFLVVVSWITVTGTVSFIKACIATILRQDGGKVALFWFGVVTQIGSALGAILAFSLVQYTTLFKAYSPCN